MARNSTRQEATTERKDESHGSDCRNATVDRTILDGGKEAHSSSRPQESQTIDIRGHS